MRDPHGEWRGVLAMCVFGASLVTGGCQVANRTAGAADLPPAAPAPRLPEQFGLGRPATAALIAPIDIDVNPAGAGLPSGQGTYAEGAAIYARTCAPCHGATGEGQGPNPRLIGAEPKEGFPFGKDFTIPRTIGNYWPYATTVYDYVHRAMPLNAPGSLTPSETYALVAYLLAENQVVPRTAVMNAETLPKVQMPARSHFVLDDRTGGQPFR
jgi:S-disulfanyl-L-cysteine oxidoreductase SoxD